MGTDAMNSNLQIQRRLIVKAWLGSVAALPLTALSTLSFAAVDKSATKSQKRFVMVILRGGMDGLQAVPAVGDPDFATARGALAQFAQPLLPLDATFALHPNLTHVHNMFQQGELGVVQAVGLAYRERSHFDAQQVLESGSTRPYELNTGWLGRALGLQHGKGLALNTTVPLVLRGSSAIDTWAPSTLPDPSVDLVNRMERMYGSDPALAAALSRARALHFDGSMTSNLSADMSAPARGNNFTVLATRAADFLAQADGPQVAVLELGGWDTHANQANPSGPFANNMRQLDSGLAALREGLLPSGTWQNTVVVVVSEFGREVTINGTQGTDHGTGGVALVLGGKVSGGRVWGEWPGLAKKDRFEGRDLRITTDIRSVLKGVLSDHMAVSTRSLNSDVFPGSDSVRSMSLLR
jgi:uncharacterized protein (DUF1501 family)